MKTVEILRKIVNCILYIVYCNYIYIVVVMDTLNLGLITKYVVKFLNDKLYFYGNTFLNIGTQIIRHSIKSNIYYNTIEKTYTLITRDYMRLYNGNYYNFANFYQNMRLVLLAVILINYFNKKIDYLIFSCKYLNIYL